MAIRTKIEHLKPSDVDEMCLFMNGLIERNNLDPKVFEYPSTKTLKASNGKSLVYLPKQLTFMLESLGINPDASFGEVAAALRDLFTVVEFQARELGMGEIYFLCADAETCKFAEHHGMEKIEKMALYRRKL